MGALAEGSKEVGIAGLVVEGVVPVLGIFDPQSVVEPAEMIFGKAVLRDVDAVLDTLGGFLPAAVAGHRPPYIRECVRDEFLGRMSGKAAHSFLLKLGRPQKVFFFPLGYARVIRLEYSDPVLRPIRARGFFPLHSAIIDR